MLHASKPRASPRSCSHWRRARGWIARARHRQYAPWSFDIPVTLLARDLEGLGLMPDFALNAAYARKTARGYDLIDVAGDALADAAAGRIRLPRSRHIQTGPLALRLCQLRLRGFHADKATIDAVMQHARDVWPTREPERIARYVIAQVPSKNATAANVLQFLHDVKDMMHADGHDGTQKALAREISTEAGTQGL